MTPAELRAALSRLGMTQAALARLCGVDDRAVRRWAAGTVAVPTYAVTILCQREQLAYLTAAPRP